jgi:predicted transposase YbfD/YdcC
VAILTFSGAAPHLKQREKWVGWSARQRARRLGFVINNSRFLLLVERESHPNLASKILGLALRRVAQDWQERWEQRPLVVESFMDESRFRGTCYRACGFEQVGMSAGFSRNARDYYTEHGQPKALYLRELESGARKTLCRPRLPAALMEHEANIAGPCPLKAGELGSLYERFRALEDPRRGHGLHHRAASTLACAAAATLLGAGSYQGFEDVCKRFTERQLRALHCHYDRKTKRHTVPSDSTFYRVLRLIDPAHMEAIIARWLLEQDIAQLQRLAVDGKVLRGTGREDGKPLALLSVVTHHLRTTLRSVPIEEKSNEIPAIKPLLEGMSIEGSLLTADAMHCQQETARLITLERSTIDLTLPKSQQRPETEIAYYVSSRTKGEASDDELLEAIVGHWDAIENGTHRVRDVSMGEDACRIAHPKAARNMVTLRNLAIGLYNRLRVEEKTQAPSLPSWRRSMKLSAALRHILR